MSPGYISAVCSATSTACHVSHRLGVQGQHPVAAPGDQPPAAQRRPDGDTALPAPRRDQSVHRADLLVGQPAGTARQQPAPNHPAPNGLRQAASRRFETAAVLASAAPGRPAIERVGVLAQLVAVRASASATPPPSTSSSSGSTSVRSRVRVNRRSMLCGSCYGVSPSSSHAACVTARRTPSSGRHHGGSSGRIPAIERAPEPRPSPSSTVSA